MIRLKLWMRRTIDRIVGYNLKLYFLCVVIGVLGGLGAVIFRYLIQFFNVIFFSSTSIPLFLIPGLGGILVGFLVFRFAEEAKGHGVPEAMVAIKYRFGVIRKRVAFILILASSITIGSGGSAGREGPIAQIGASLASVVGQFLRLRPKDLRILVVAGVVAGISGTFNAPLGALIFGFELFIVSVEAQQLIGLILASVTGKIVASFFLGDYPAFLIPPDIAIPGVTEYPYIIAMSILIGVTGSLWVKLFYAFEENVDKIKVYNYFKPMLGGLGVGILAYMIPGMGTMGVGYEFIEEYLSAGSIGEDKLLVAGIVKLIATILTIGSGGSGGIFSPSLFIGSTLGGGFAEYLSNYIHYISDSRAYALIGMAVMFTAVAKAPLTTLIMIPEITRNYNLFIPIMIGNSISYIISLLILGRESIYTIKVEKVRVRRV